MKTVAGDGQDDGGGGHQGGLGKGGGGPQGEDSAGLTETNAENIKKKNDVEKSKVDNTNYRVELKEGKEAFSCNICRWVGNKAKNVKNHILMKLRERPPNSDDEDESAKKLKDESYNKSFLNKTLIKQWEDVEIPTTGK